MESITIEKHVEKLKEELRPQLKDYCKRLKPIYEFLDEQGYRDVSESSLLECLECLVNSFDSNDSSEKTMGPFVIHLVNAGTYIELNIKLGISIGSSTLLENNKWKYFDFAL